MKITEKGKRLRRAIESVLGNVNKFSFIGDVRSVESVNVQLQRVVDKDGATITDYSILEEAKSGDYTGNAMITIGAGIPDDPYGIEERCFNIEGRFIILDYVESKFIVDVLTPRVFY